jgi:hypothetical protein
MIKVSKIIIYCCYIDNKDIKFINRILILEVKRLKNPEKSL